jgi:RNA polymerase sigma factor (sigma-70 family)
VFHLVNGEREFSQSFHIFDFRFERVRQCRRHLPPVLFVHFKLPLQTTSQTHASFLQIFCRRPVRDKKLGSLACYGHIFGVHLPDLGALKTGDAGAWDEAFHWVWPTVFAVAKLKLQPYLPSEIEDVAIESIEQLMEKVREVKSVEELKPLAASIAHHRAVSLLRERFAKKRGEGKTTSLDASPNQELNQNEPASSLSPFAELEQMELAERLGRSLAELKPPLGEILSDFFLHGLRYEQIANKQGVAIGSVGVYLKRGLEAMRRIWGREEII